MSTIPVRFEFQCENAPHELKFTHNISKDLVRPDAQAAQADPSYIQNFVSALQPIMSEHEAVCRSFSSPNCQAKGCNLPTTKVLTTPMSWLHIIQDPFVNVWVSAFCGKSDCEMLIRRNISDIMSVMNSDPSAAADGPKDSKEILACQVCASVQGTKKCGECKAVAYCGREHQKADWKVHKRICALIRQ